MQENMKRVFGPVPSRRLGRSLGVDTINFKVCSLDCIYCQLGRTSLKTINRGEYVPVDEILRDVQEVLDTGQEIDYITLSGSGEPTLHSSTGRIISEIKSVTEIPVAVLTNGTLLTDAGTRAELSGADLLIPSLDAVTQDVFEAVNRPYPGLEIKEIIKGLEQFIKNYKGKIWLEVMFVKDINDGKQQVDKMSELFSELNVAKIQLNTVVRPPAEPTAAALTLDEMNRIKEKFGERAEIIGYYSKNARSVDKKEIDLAERIIDTLKRRPCTSIDLSSALNVHPNEVIKYLTRFTSQGLLKTFVHGENTFYFCEVDKHKR